MPWLIFVALISHKNGKDNYWTPCIFKNIKYKTHYDVPIKDIIERNIFHIYRYKSNRFKMGSKTKRLAYEINL